MGVYSIHPIQEQGLKSPPLIGGGYFIGQGILLLDIEVLFTKSAILKNPNNLTLYNGWITRFRA